MSELIGKTISNYQIIEKIGGGGMADVYLANQPSMDRDVVLKLMLDSRLENDDVLLQRFYREVKVIAQLQHPHILPVYDFGEYDGKPYIVMSYVSGGTLGDVIAQGPMKVNEVLRIMKQMTSALDFVHSQGIIHRDFKPGNVLLDNQANCYLADFGLAKTTTDDLQITGDLIIGTPDYMAPDLADSEHITHSIDIYALGITIYQMLTGELPFTASSGMGVLMAHLTAEIPNVLEKRSDLSDEIHHLIRKSMAKKPKDRYLSAGLLFEALRTALEPDIAEEKVSHKPAMLYTDEKGHVIYTNNVLLRLLKRNEADTRAIIGKQLHEVLGIGEKPAKSLINDISKIGNVYNQKLDLLYKSDEPIKVSCNGTATYDDEGKCIGADFIFNEISRPSPGLSSSVASESAFSTREKEFRQFYFASQYEAIRLLLQRVGGPKLGKTLERIINETAERNDWGISINDSQIDIPSITEAFVFHALLVKIVSFAVKVIGAKLVKKQMQIVDDRLGDKAVELSRKLGLQELFTDF